MIHRILRALVAAPLLVAALCVGLTIAGWQAFRNNPKDALPDIAENQVIVLTEWSGRSPRDIDEQVTYPLTVALQAVPGVREIRATSGFGWSLVYSIFDDDVDFYWARTRVFERLEIAAADLPSGVTPVLGPDATALGQVFWYTVENSWYCPKHPGLRFEADGTVSPRSREAILEERPGIGHGVDDHERGRCPLDGSVLVHSRLPLDRLRSIQDFEVKLALESVEGVSEVASVGGYVREYHIDIDPEALAARAVQVTDLVAAVRSANLDVGAEVVEHGGMEVLVRGVGFVGGAERGAGSRAEREAAVIRDLENVVLAARDGTPVNVRQVANVSVGPGFRRGALDKMGAEAVGAAIIMRFGENPLEVITSVKNEIAGLEETLPPGVRLVAFYDRSELIRETMDTLGSALAQALLITVIVVVLFLAHLRAGLAIGATLPLAVLFAFVCMQALGIGSDIMSLAGIAIAIGTMVDMAIVVTENIYQHLSDHRRKYVTVKTGAAGTSREVIDRGARREVVLNGAREVSGAVLTAISTTVISFLPVFLLEGEAARLFTPLAWTKTLCLIGAALMALFIVPPLASIALAESRVPPHRRPGFAAATGILIAVLWLVAAGTGFFSPEFARLGGMPLPVAALLVAAAGAGLTWLLLRERVRPPEDSPVGRAILAVYEPVLRWVLRRPLLFLTLPATIVLTGLWVWLGPAGLLTPIVRSLALVGVDIAGWSTAWWAHLALGLVAGMLVMPLAVETLVLLGWVRQPRVSRLVRCAVAATVSVVVALTLHAVGFASRNASAVHAVMGSSPDAARSDPREHALLADWLENRGGIGEEFMPPLDEGDFLYMPSLLPAASINTVMDVMQTQDVNFMEIPEVEMVVGKLGRIESALDPAPLGMLETVIDLKPRAEWPLIDDRGRRRRRTMDEVWQSIQEAGRFPGVLPSARLQPIRTRVEMLSTGLNATIGIKVYGDSIESAEALAVNIEQILRADLPEAETVNALRTNRKPYLEIQVDREAIARHGIPMLDVQRTIEVAVGGTRLGTTFEGLDRYPIRVRYARELRDDVGDLEQVLVPTPSGSSIPLGQLAEFRSVVGPMSIRREGPKFVSYVILGSAGLDEATLVARGERALRRKIIDGDLEIPTGAHFRWTGTYERHLEARRRLTLILPAVLLINLLLIYAHFRRIVLSLLVFLAIPVSFAGGFILLRLWPGIQNLLYRVGLVSAGFEGDAIYLTVAVWIGFIALFGIAVDDGIVLGTYLRQAFARAGIDSVEEIAERVVEAGKRRIRPCLMTTATTLAALVPVLLSTGRGSDLMVPMAVPIFGGMLAELVTLFVVPCCYYLVKRTKWRLGVPDPDFAPQR